MQFVIRPLPSLRLVPAGMGETNCWTCRSDSRDGNWDSATEIRIVICYVRQIKRQKSAFFSSPQKKTVPRVHNVGGTDGY